MRKDKFYIIVLDRGGLIDSFSPKKFHKQLVSSEGVKAWWHYIESTYIIRVDNNITADNITNLIIKLTPKKKFFVTEINIRNYNGWLPKDSWDWFANQ